MLVEVATHARLPPGGVHGWRVCPQAHPGCPTRGAPPAPQGSSTYLLVSARSCQTHLHSATHKQRERDSTDTSVTVGTHFAVVCQTPIFARRKAEREKSTRAGVLFLTSHMHRQRERGLCAFCPPASARRQYALRGAYVAVPRDDRRRTIPSPSTPPFHATPSRRTPTAS